jgi:hypothetical protein
MCMNEGKYTYPSFSVENDKGETQLNLWPNCVAQVWEKYHTDHSFNILDSLFKILDPLKCQEACHKLMFPYKSPYSTVCVWNQSKIYITHLFSEWWKRLNSNSQLTEFGSTSLRNVSCSPLIQVLRLLDFKKQILDLLLEFQEPFENVLLP